MATAVDNVVYTAAQLNLLIGNLLETAPSKASGVDVASGTTKPAHWTTSSTNLITERLIYSGNVDEFGTSISTDYNVPTGTAGPDISAYCGSYAMVFHGCRLSNGTAGKYIRATYDLNGDGGNGGRDV